VVVLRVVGIILAAGADRQAKVGKHFHPRATVDCSGLFVYASALDFKPAQRILSASDP
jgi:hypothetical protein